MQPGKEGSFCLFVVLFARDGIEKPEDSTRIRTGDRLEQVACQVADLALEMTEDSKND